MQYSASKKERPRVLFLVPPRQKIWVLDRLNKTFDVMACYNIPVLFIAVETDLRDVDDGDL
jgi:hypothetical protein